MTKEKFQAEFCKAADEVEKSRSINEICMLLGVGRSVYYRWKRGKNAPILLARHGALRLLHGLVAELGVWPSADPG